ncbi:MAG TPA: hypothetical protein PKD59_16845 [Miltoncostaeaceae bacterium]|nr:hypothetical protein [Miltoncostaeaceae bacterium]
MSAGPLADRAARFAAAVAWLDEPAWAGRVSALAGEVAPAPSRPTYRDLATTGTALVAALADEGRWPEAAEQARDLKRLFGATPDELGPIVIDAFDGLLAAAIARDREDLQDFVELVEALFP